MKVMDHVSLLTNTEDLYIKTATKTTEVFHLLQNLFNLLKLTLTTKEEINGMDKYLQQKPK